MPHNPQSIVNYHCWDAFTVQQLQQQCWVLVIKSGNDKTKGSVNIFYSKSLFALQQHFDCNELSVFKTWVEKYNKAA